MLGKGGFKRRVDKKKEQAGDIREERRGKTKRRNKEEKSW